MALVDVKIVQSQWERAATLALDFLWLKSDFMLRQD